MEELQALNISVLFDVARTGHLGIEATPSQLDIILNLPWLRYAMGGVVQSAN